MKIVNLIENTSGVDGCVPQHGARANNALTVVIPNDADKVVRTAADEGKTRGHTL